MGYLQDSVRGGLLRPVRKLGLEVTRVWPWPVQVKLRTGQRMYVDIRSRVGRRLFVNGQFDPEVFTPVRAALKTGGTFLDVGCNAGYYSMLALDVVGKAGAVHSFDVDERALRCVRKTIQTQSIPNWFVHANAVSNQDATGSLELTGDCGWTRVREGALGPKVETLRLDSWYAKSGVTNIQAIKMDIEGGELAALQGAKELLKREKPVLVCELVEKHTERMGYKADDIFEVLKSIGYRWRWQEGLWFPGIVAEWAG